MLAATDSETVISAPIVGIVLLTSAFVFTFGYAVAVMRRANKDYKAVKASVPTLRKGFWATWRTMMKAALIITVIGFILVAWVVRDFKDLAADPQPSPAPSATHRK